MPALKESEDSVNQKISFILQEMEDKSEPINARLQSANSHINHKSGKFDYHKASSSYVGVARATQQQYKKNSRSSRTTYFKGNQN